MDKDLQASNKKKKSIFSKLKDNKKMQYLIIGICFCLILILFFSSSIISKNATSQVTSIDEYVNNLEKRLVKTLSKVDGAGDVSVVITVESGMETVLANKTVTTNNNGNVVVEESPIIVNGKTITVMEKYPKIVGVLIVCEGANNIAVMRKIQQATISLLDININQIEILSMS